MKTKKKQLKVKEKNIEAIQDHKKQLANINDDYKNILLSKEREIFKNIYNERLNKIEESNKNIDYNNLKYTVISTGEEFEFDKSENPLAFLNDIKTGKISLEETNKLQKDYTEYLNKIQKGNKSDEQKKTLANINIIFNARKNAIKFIGDNGSIILEAKRKATEGKVLKILTPKQTLQRLSIALAQIKAGNN